MMPLPFPLARVGMTPSQAVACLLCAPFLLFAIAMIMVVLA